MTLPETRERARHELPCVLPLGRLECHQRWPAPEVGKAYRRAQHLCQQVGETAQLFPVLWGLWHFHYVGRAADSARAGRTASYPRPAAPGTSVFPGSSLYAGRCRGRLSAVVLPSPAGSRPSLSDPQQHHALTYLFGANPGVFSLAFASLPCG